MEGKDKADQSHRISLNWKKILLKTFKRRLPIFRWIQSYSKKDFISDAIAGITVGLTVVPQSMAYAAIAGLSPEYGLYSSYIGVLLYVFLGSCSQAAIGPTAIISLLTLQTCGPNYPQCAILTGFYAGVIELLLALLRLGWVVSFISEPVTVGFTAGASLTVLSSQIKSLFGLKGEKGSGFLGIWKKVFQNFNTIQMGDTVMGISSFVVLLLLRKLNDMNHSNKWIKSLLWFISMSRNVIVIVLTTLIAFIWSTSLDLPFKIVGPVQGGFPKVSLPPFHLPLNTPNNLANDSQAEFHNNDDETFLDFWASWNLIKTGPFVIALVSILQNVAISKAFGSGQKVDAIQEMIALGASNVVGGFFSAIPTTAAFSRSAVNEASGVKSPLGGLFTGILVLLSLCFLTPSFYYIPKASLAAVIIAAVMFMIQYESILPMWRISKMDAAACIITFLSSLVWGMEYGIVVGVGVSIGGLLLESLHPVVQSELKEDEDSGLNYLLISPDVVGINFPSMDHISSQIQKLVLKHKTIRIIVLDFKKWINYDYTAANGLICLLKGMKKNGKIFIFMDCTDKWKSVLKTAGLQHPPCTNRGEEFKCYLTSNIDSVDLNITNQCQMNNTVVTNNASSPLQETKFSD